MSSEPDEVLSTGGAEDAGATTPSSEATSTARAPSPAQVAAREKAKSTKTSYDETLKSCTTSLNASPDPNTRLSHALAENDTALKNLKPSDNIAEKLKTMAEGENNLATTDPERTALKQVQDARKNYASAAVGSTTTAARHEHIAGTSPFTTTSKKKQIFTDRTVGAVKNFVASRGRFSPLKAIVDKVNEAKSKADLKEAQEFLAAQVAVQRKEDPEFGKVMSKAEGEDAREKSEVAGGSSPEAAPQEQEKARNMFEELKTKDIKYMTTQGSHRISYNNGVISSKNPEALAKFVSAQGWKDFKITTGSPENGLALLNELHKEGTPDVTFSPEMRSKISSVKGGEESLLIADTRSKAFHETPLVEQSERSLHALTYAKLSEDPNDEDAAKARKYLTKNIMTDSDRKDTLELLEAKVAKGEMTKEEFNAEAKSVLASSSNKAEVKSGLSDTTKAGMAPTHTLTAASTASAQPDAAPTATASPSPTTPPATATTTATVNAAQPPTTPQPPAPGTTATATAQGAQPPSAPPPPSPGATATPTSAQGAQPTTAPAQEAKTRSATPSTAPTHATPSTTPKPAARTEGKGSNSIPEWAKLGLKHCMAILDQTPAGNKATELASTLGNRMQERMKDPENQAKYIEGVKEFLNTGGKNSGTSFENFATELAKQFPKMIPALMKTMTPPEVTKVSENLAKDDNVSHSDTALKGIEHNMPTWKKEPFGHPKSKSDSGESKKANTSAPATDRKEKNNSEVKHTEKAVKEAREKIDEKKSPKQEHQQTQTSSASPPSPHSKP
jgi:hypothetical protein